MIDLTLKPYVLAGFQRRNVQLLPSLVASGTLLDPPCQTGPSQIWRAAELSIGDPKREDTGRSLSICYYEMRQHSLFLKKHSTIVSTHQCISDASGTRLHSARNPRHVYKTPPRGQANVSGTSRLKTPQREGTRRIRRCQLIRSVTFLMCTALKASRREPAAAVALRDCFRFVSLSLALLQGLPYSHDHIRNIGAVADTRRLLVTTYPILITSR